MCGKDQPARLLQFRHMFFLSMANAEHYLSSISEHTGLMSRTIDKQRSIELVVSLTVHSPSFSDK